MRATLLAGFVCGIVMTFSSQTGAQSQPSPLIAKLTQHLSGTARVNAINVEGKTLNIVVNDRDVSEDLYLTLVTATCAGLGADAKQFKEIAFGSRFAEQGYVFGAPGKCAEIVKMPPDRQASTILADTTEL